ncbi:MAG: 2-oxo acid dehydrogenase subunit E2, partial [Bdellovibrionaceae bacterium]|nr:2-oxo acid dehydrogenase subunit E2 [Pseudobdellovibrionaceae bacterium]
LEKQGLKIGYLPFFIKALIPTLKEFPLFNSSYDNKTKEIVFKKHINFGFAVDSPQGLLVPVLKQAEKKSLIEIIKELIELSQKTREGLIEREHLKGAGFTLTNLGSLGGLYGTPIIQSPEMAILGIYKSFKQVIKNEKNEFEEKDFINFSITCDHRFIDGATAVRFLKSFIQKIEEPSLLLLE